MRSEKTKSMPGETQGAERHAPRGPRAGGLGELLKVPAPARRPPARVDPPTSQVGESTPRWVPLGQIHAAAHQPRLIAHDEDATRDLLESIRADTLMSPPQVRPHPDRPGHYETVAGHRRLAALRRLAEDLLAKGATHPVLRLGPTVEATAVQVLVSEVDAIRAQRRALVENTARKNLTHWEVVVAVSEHVAALEAAGRGAELTVRGVADALGLRKWLGESGLKIARAMTSSVLHAAGLLHAPDAPLREARVEALKELSQKQLHEIADLADPAARAAALRTAVRGDEEVALERVRHEPDDDASMPQAASPASEAASSPIMAPDMEPERAASAAPPVAAVETGPTRCGGRAAGAPASWEYLCELPLTAVGDHKLCIDIRRPLASLGSRDARKRIRDMLPALAVLLEQAAPALTTHDLAQLQPSFASIRSTVERLEA